MRIARFDLLRYGKFTDKSLALPRSTRDFHLIVGPNEAGKSTLRNAIQDLLFGIEPRSRYNFLHAHTEMRLGALIEDDSNNLDFVRTKARTKALQTSNQSPLADNALTPFLGQIDRIFFDHMFGLDHERLVTGGQEILSAANDIGQILFQAAAGIGSLGDIRDKLEDEADKLWAKRKSNDREYYIASNELDQAELALKQATVRTKDWQEARTKVDQISDDLMLAQKNYKSLEQERIQLERVRRVAPILITLAELERQLFELGEVVPLSEYAAEQLANSEKEISIASQSLKLFQDQATELQVKMQALHPKEYILARSADIQALSEKHQQLRNHESDISKREEEIRVLWQYVEESARQLGWHEVSEDVVAKRLPSSLIRSSIYNLIRRQEALTQALSAAEDLFNSRQEEIKAINAEITLLPETQIPINIIDALAKARSLGDVTAQYQRIETQISRHKRDLDSMVIELGAWAMDTDSLRKLVPPTQDETNALVKRLSDLELAVSMINVRIAETKSDIQTLQLEISQYKSAHHPVTLADIQQVRLSRDSTWQAIKNGNISLNEVASSYEIEVTKSDTLSDIRHDKAQEETELQSKMDRLEQLQQQLDNYELRMQNELQVLNNLDRDWDVSIKTLGLAGMPLLQVNYWRDVRDRVLTAADALEEALASQKEFKTSVESAKSALSEAMKVIIPEGKSLNLSALILLADEIVNTASRAQERSDALATQKIRAEAALPDSNNKVSQAHSAIDAWLADLQKNLALAHLPLDTSMGAIEAALNLFEDMNQHLQKIREIRVNRIDMMRQDLSDFSASAKSLAEDIAPEIRNESASQIALTITNFLSKESTAFQDLSRLKTDFERIAERVNAASSRIADAEASLEPLLRLTGSTDNNGLRAAIKNSDRLRLLTSEVDQAVKQLIQTGDGLDRVALELEFSAIDANKIIVRLSEIKLQIDEAVAQQSRLSGELTSAEALLGKIAGQDEAARAESQRQEALARMSNATERYIKVYTAAKLLRWSIERFRESKQGPMLARASSIFSCLTQGAFTKLVVDYESDPLKLSGLRATKDLVDIEGMSEGTRDQLYFALRIAALELHLEQTMPLPFIADDLFINYDDVRAKAGLEVLAKLSENTQVIFLTHHDYLVPVAQSVFGDGLNLIVLN